MTEIVKKYQQKLTARNYSKNTIEIYTCYLIKFLEQTNTNPYHITTKELDHYIYTREFTSSSQQNQVISSLKKFAHYILGKKYEYLNKIERPRQEKKLPEVIDSKVIIPKIHAIKNIKHKSIIMLAYSCTLRVGEVINLKIADIDSQRMIINIKQSKGNKDRIVLLSPKLLQTLREYFLQYTPHLYLFNGQSSVQYSATSCNKIVKKYLGKQYHFHTLRHSGATTMFENGTELALIQKLLGHANIKTTQIYTHISTRMIQNVQPPI